MARNYTVEFLFLWLLALVAGLCALPVRGEAAVLSVSSPDVKLHEASVEFGAALEKDSRPAKDGAREYVVELGYSPTAFWNMAVDMAVEHDGEGEARYAATGFKNTFQLVGQSAAVPLSVGMRVQYGVAHQHGEADDVALRLLLRHKRDDVEVRLNLGVEHEVGAHADNAWEGDIRSSLRFPWREELTFALDYLGDTKSLHNIRDFDAQDHRVGPVLYAGAGGFSYEVGYLHGFSDRAPHHTVKFGVGYSF